MFSFPSSKAHSRRRRIFASNYSRTAVSRSQVQTLINLRIAKVLKFIDKQTSGNETKYGEPRSLLIRNILRALQADIYTAFAFSEAIGSNFLDNLSTGINTLEDLGMERMDLFHDDRREAFFFWESETPFKYVTQFLSWRGSKAHAKAQRWIVEFMTNYESNFEFQDLVQKVDNSVSSFATSIYGKLLFHRDPKTGGSLAWADRASEIMDHVVAGQDAVPAALESIIYRISSHSAVQSRLRYELLASLPSANEIQDFALVDNLRYLNAVVMEGLRLVESISSYQTRVVSEGGCVIAGYHLPQGTTVVAQPYIINRQPDVFPSPNTFDPSRWLLPVDQYRTLAKSMWTYSSGPRSCIGRELSLTIIKNVLVNLYSRYKTTLVRHDNQDQSPNQQTDFFKFRFDRISIDDEAEHPEVDD